MYLLVAVRLIRLIKCLTCEPPRDAKGNKRDRPGPAAGCLKATKETLAGKKEKELDIKEKLYERREEKIKRSLMSIITPSHALVYDVRVLYITFVLIALFRLTAGCAHQPVAAWEDQGGLAKSALPERCGGNTGTTFCVYDLREGGVLWCESGIPPEPAAESVVHGA